MNVNRETPFAATSQPSRTKPDQRHTVVWIVALVLLALAIVGTTWWTINRDQDQTPSWLFSHTASSGTLSETVDGDYTLTLSGIDPHVMAFTDRPARDSAVVSTRQFIEEWPSLFADSPPNAVLVQHDVEGNTDSVVLTITNPRLTDSADPLDVGTLTFDATIISAEHPANLKRLTRGIHTIPPANFAAVSLFIDDVANPWAPNATFECVVGTGTPDAQGLGGPSVYTQSVTLPDQQGVVDMFQQECEQMAGTFSRIS